MDLGNPVEIEIRHLLIGGMVCLGHRDRFPMVSAQCMWCTLDRTYGESWRKAINCHDSPSYYTTWTLNLEKILRLCQYQQEALTYRWDPKVVIYPYGLGHYWWRLVATCILNIGTMISHGIEIVCSLGWSKGYVIMKYVTTIIPLVEFDICSLELEYVNRSHNNVICNSRIWEVILLGNSTTLLYCGYQFIGSLHVVDSRLRIWALGFSL